MITLYAYAACDSDESDPDELFVLTTPPEDVPATLREHFPADVTYEFLYEDEYTHEWVFDVWDGDDKIAVLYTSEV
ncbi:hypothetical protein L829_1122 [Mycobacteroides abscessus MAB_030201_1075]|uniref:Uncharacterized protein n=1 Tax=Mycobacteroides abscessus MAB_030201_1075 TaxID=1335410 RepID=A0A829PEM8_9MYCO|nr:hypothetical protein [Mycobacteroides abscessus]ETZ70225.1 hypothetical protein L835_3139 [Mycobacteroides abscessus MAB_110811_1470]ETZ87574.1 hypothetical protein L829_1122 [Mycobacteroides abscessus MAB_030201_1075]ETZ92218.1 hypothetical protein L828_3209 [Mycobacteroides abscessus MAB_030201_1061]